MSVYQQLIKLLTPNSLFLDIKSDTQKWQLSCSCGYKDNLWNYGGIRYKAIGAKLVLQKCRGCQRIKLLSLKKQKQQV